MDVATEDITTREIKERIITTPQDLFQVYEEIKTDVGWFVMIGVPIPDDGRINSHCAMWIEHQISNPNIISHRSRSRFCSEAYHCVINNTLNTMPFVSHILLMDADEWPVDNKALLYMIEADKDVVVGPTPILKGGKGICWNINKYSPYAEPFWIDFINWNDLPDELFRVNFSGGPWLIKRKVLEKMKHPYFKDDFTTMIRQTGQDIDFCKKVDEAGFEIWCEPRAKFYHERICNMYNARQEQEETDTHGLPWGGFALGKEDWKFLVEIIEKEKIETILEFGSGLSTLLFADLGLKIYSFDEDKKYQLERVRSRNQSSNIQLAIWPGNCFDIGRKYDLAFVDGPKGKGSGGPGREESIKMASKYSDVVVVHDAKREDEVKWQKKYLEPDFNLIHYHGLSAYWKRK